MRTPVQNTSRAETNLKLCKAGTAVALLLITAFSALTFSTRIEDTRRYFASSSFTFIFYALIILTLLFAIVMSLLLKKADRLAPTDNAASKYSSLLPAIALIPILIQAFRTTPRNFFSVAIMATALFSVVFCLTSLSTMPKSLALISGYMQILFCIFIIAKLYLDHSVELNAPVKVLTQFAAAATTLSVVADLRYLVERPVTAQFIFSKSAAILFSLISGIGALTEVLPHPDKYGTDYLIFPIFFFAYGIHTAVRFFSATMREADPAEITVSQTESAASDA